MEVYGPEDRVIGEHPRRDTLQPVVPEDQHFEVGETRHRVRRDNGDRVALEVERGE